MNERDCPVDAPWIQPRPKWRRRLLIGSLVIVPLCLALPFVYFLFSVDEEMQQAIADADAWDLGWRTLELERKRALIPDSENSGLVLLTAKARMPANWPVWDHA